MDQQVENLVQKAWIRYQDTPSNQRLIIGISGIPGSGKTTLSKLLTQRLNTRAERERPGPQAPALFLPMDGFHYTRAHLSSMPNPEEAHARRGAAFTFDADKYLALVKALRQPLPSPEAAAARSVPAAAIRAPTFDHAVKDPVEGDVVVAPEKRIIVIEGNYVNLDKDVWRDAASLLDESWFMKVDFEVARVRLRERHVRAGIVDSLEEGDRRAMENDLVNGREIVDHQVRVDEVIECREDAAWVGT